MINVPLTRHNGDIAVIPVKAELINSNYEVFNMYALGNIDIDLNVGFVRSILSKLQNFFGYF